MPKLELRVTEFTGLTHWRWKLTADGALLADQEVRLDEGDWQYEAATDLPGYVSWHAPPDERYAADEQRIVDEVGDWLGEHLFGPGIAKALTRRRQHVTVRVILPPEAKDLAFLPLEIARVGGRSLADHDVTLVLATDADELDDEAGPRDRLRILGLFSLPEGGTPLNLRRERHALVQLVDGLAANGYAAEVRVLQYGVTRKRLRDVLLDADGWDIIHISGHGSPGELLLETAEGSPDPVTTGELADLLDTAREHVRLITLSACWSAALGAAEQRRLLHLPVPGAPARTAKTVAPAAALGSLVADLAGRIGCAVLAMRFPVDDEFAIGFSAKLYELLAAKGYPLPRAVTLTLKQLTADGGTGGREFPALSLVSPVIFGDRATELILRAPKHTEPVSYATDTLKLTGFPPQPDRFVGRTAVMTRASEALASNSGIPGVLLHGMPGGGKTACALELAYSHEHAFEKLIWFKAPDEGLDITGALKDFAQALEDNLNGFEMIHLVNDAKKLTGFLPRLTNLLKLKRLLIVIDNAESLLSESDQWRDSRWSQVFGALTDHSGLGRVILTSRRVPAAVTDASTTAPSPADFSPHGLRVLPVDALSADEALLLARELLHLDRLIQGGLPGLDRATSRRLALGILNTTQGHPKLLELADGQAEHPDRLTALIESGGQAWRDQGGLPDGFFTTSAPAADPADYLHVLAAWTKAASGTLSPGERDLFWFLCCLEEPDREQPLPKIVWPQLWQRLNRDGEPPELDQALTSVASLGLIALREETATEDESYALHPGIAAAGRNHAGPDFQHATDTETAAYWDAVYAYASGENDDGTVHTRLLVRAGLAAVPYLLRQEQWTRAGVLLENAFIWDPSRANAAAVLPAIEQITRHEPRQDIVLARVLLVLDPAAGEKQLRTALADAAARGDHEAASRAARSLVNLCMDSGRLAEALTLAGQIAEHTRQAGHGPWTQLLDEVQRLQVLGEMGQASLVLDEVQRLREHLDTLPADPGPNETADPWGVRETLLDTGRFAARQLGQWQEALNLNAAQTASKRDRRAPAADIARTQFNDYGPLLLLGRTDEALYLLQDCRQVFQDTHDFQALGKILSALAAIEDKRGHGNTAIHLERDALRYKYLVGDVTSIAVSYHNLGNYFHCHSRQAIPALSGHLTAALIRALTGIGGTGDSGSAIDSVQRATEDLRIFGTAAEPPATIADLCRKLGDIPGTDPDALITQLSPDAETAERTLRGLIAQAQELAAPKRKPLREILRRRRA